MDKKRVKKIHHLMHETGLIETYTNLREAKSDCRSLNERYGFIEYWIKSVKIKSNKKQNAKKSK